MVGAWVIEVGADDTLTARGYFQFVQLPAPNDRLTLAGDLFGVILGEHDAAMRPGLVP